VTPFVTLHVWRVPRRSVPHALVRMALDRRRLRATPGVRFAKLLGTGTGTGDGFSPTDADPTRYAALVVWDAAAAAEGFDGTPVARAWERIAEGRLRIDLSPLASRGRWSGIEPFGAPQGTAEGVVLALTRARLRPRKAVTFWRAVPPVAAAVAAAPGLLTRFGIGEAPIGWQGTVSVWRNTADLVEFAYRHPVHRAAILRTPAEGWYTEDLFARFAVLGVRGDRRVVGWSDGGERGRA
jgi:hypothetical protein